MTDNEIIKALENCMTPNNACGDCSLRKECDNNTRTLENYALALINRQNAKIEELQHKIMSCNSEIERLQEKYNKTMYNLKAVLNERADHTEAIKEFADMLCINRVSNDPVVIAVKCLLKEMEVEH